jgi:hypothetical protein
MATTLKISANRLNMITNSPPQHHTASSQAFSSRPARLFISAECT